MTLTQADDDHPWKAAEQRRRVGKPAHQNLSLSSRWYRAQRCVGWAVPNVPMQIAIALSQSGVAPEVRVGPAHPTATAR